jgi:NAD-dependent dihydropyrimidine dehydrogenase PreA subunit
MISAIHAATWTVVVSRGQSRDPKKREIEQALADAAQKIDGVDTLIVPHLYDLPKSSESFKRLAEIEGNLIVVSWIYSRAAHWVLDRNGIQGQVGQVQLGEPQDEDGETVEASPVDRVAEQQPRPDRSIHCIDLKVTEDAQTLIGEIQRIVGFDPVVDHETVAGRGIAEPRSLPVIGGKLIQVDEQTSRRWYPVIDFSRCTNCMECVDFCLFGVYGVDGAETILVEQPDNCRKGCPACSRVCPENAIIFPQHKAPAIAGAEVAGDEGFKIDLSLLFGAPDKGEDPIETAARERDEQLLLAGREAVGIDDRLRKRQADRVATPKDQLDLLIDSLDQLNL